MPEIKCTCYVMMDGAEPVPIESLTQEQKEYCKRVWTERLSRVSSAYFSNHPEEYAVI